MPPKKKGKSTNRRSQPPEILDMIANFSRDVNVQNEITTDFTRRRLRNQRIERALPLYQVPRYRRTYLPPDTFRHAPANIMTVETPIPHLRHIHKFEHNPHILLQQPTEGNLRAFYDHWSDFRSWRILDVLDDPPPYIWNSVGDRSNIRGRVLSEIETNPRTVKRSVRNRRRYSAITPDLNDVRYHRLPSVRSAPFRKSKRRRSTKKKKKKRKVKRSKL